MPLIQICKTNQTVLNTPRTTNSITQFHAKWSLQYFNMYYEVSKKCCKFRKTDSTFIAINNIHYKFNATHLRRTTTKSNCKRMHFKCLYYLLPSTLLFFTLVHISYSTQLLPPSACVFFNQNQHLLQA